LGASRTGGENDSASRQLARYITEVGRSYEVGVKPVMISRWTVICAAATILHSPTGIRGGTLTEWREDFHHQHQDVRTEHGV